MVSNICSSRSSGSSPLAPVEIDDAERPLAALDREGDAPMQAVVGRCGRTEEIGICREVGNPRDPAGFPHTTGQPDTGIESYTTAHRLELRERQRGRVPELDASEDVGLVIDLPEAPHLPAQVPGDGLDEEGSGIGDRPGFGEDTGDVMLGGQTLPPPLPIRDIAYDSGEHAGAGQRKLADRQLQRECLPILASPLAPRAPGR